MSKITNKQSETRPQDKIQVTKQQSVSYAGPIPPPVMMAEYKTIDAGLPDRIVSMAEKAQNSQNEIMQGEMHTRKWALFAVWSISIFVISIGAFLSFYDKELLGGITMAIGTAPIWKNLFSYLSK